MTEHTMEASSATCVQWIALSLPGSKYNSLIDPEARIEDAAPVNNALQMIIWSPDPEIH